MQFSRAGFRGPRSGYGRACRRCEIWQPHAGLLEPLLFEEVNAALRLLAMSDAELDRGQVEVTVSMRRVAGGEWRHFGTHYPSRKARSALEDFVVMKLPRPDDLEQLLNGEDVTIEDFSEVP